MNDVAIRLQNIVKNFPHQEVFYNVNFEIQKGEFICLVGKSGSGKSTLLRMIAHLENPTAGDLNLAHDLNNSVSYVFQDAQLLPWKTVFENVRLPLDLATAKLSPEEKIQKVLASLKKVHLENVAAQFSRELSGGMKMRVSLARALVTNPRLLLLDEPFAALDENTRFEMQDQLLELWQKEQLTLVFVTHSLFEAAYLSQRVILLKGPDGKDWQYLKIELPNKRTVHLRTSNQLNEIIKDLSQRLRP